MQRLSPSAAKQPLIRWAGSKRQIVQRLARLCDVPFLRYVEPFAGSCALFVALEPVAALLADKNADLIETYQVIRRSPKRLHSELSELTRSKRRYYSFRSLDPSKLSQFQRAVRFMYLNRFCFNGIYRTNLDGKFNVPYSASKTGGFPTLDEFRSFAMLLDRADLRAWDFGTTLRHVRAGDLVYLDPPYAVESRRVFKEYGASTFNVQDLQRLERHLERIDKRGARFLVSYADCQEARRAASQWFCTRIRVRRNVAGFEGARKTAYEVLFSNYPIRPKTC